MAERNYNSIAAEKLYDSVESKSSVDQAVSASDAAYRAYSAVTLNKRQEIIEKIKETLIPLVPDLAQRIVAETGYGNAEDKIIKLMLAILKSPGVQDLITDAQTGDDGMTLYELSAYGVVCAAQPCTNPCATLINNTICMLAAGNAVIHIPHPKSIAVSKYLTDIISRAIVEACGIENLVVCLSETSMLLASEIMYHPDVSLVVVTGNAKMSRISMGCGKRVICAGPANPVVIVDETANLKKAAADIVSSTSFDYNTMCVSEKSIVIAEEAASEFVRALEAENAYFVRDEAEMLSLSKAVLTEDMKMNIALKGRSANEILRAAGISAQREYRLIVVDTVKLHPFVTLELMMPLVPMVRVKDFDTALETALFIEQGLRHTACIHSQSIERMSRAAQVMQTSIFVKNGPALSGVGFNGEGYASFTIATITGEGTTTARNFARRRRCTLITGMSIR